MKQQLNGVRWIFIGVLSLYVSYFAHADGDVVFKPYGFINANMTGASGGLDSYGNTNMSAPTTVTPSSSVNSIRARDSFQVAQSRFGTYITQGDLTGRFEMDFIDFTKASPTTKANPRLRIANVDYHIDSSQTLSLGQDWDLFSSPGKPFTYNFVGLYFHAGNAGFLKQQIRYRVTTESGWTVATAVGLLNQNTNASDSEVEMSGLPTLSALVSNLLSKEAEVGATVIVGSVRPASLPVEMAGVYGVNTFFNWEAESGFKIHEAFYYGQNLGSAGALTLANNSVNGSRHEFGGYLSFYKDLSERFSTQGGVGGAKVIESNGSTIDSLSGNTILSNWKIELALAYHPSKPMSLYIQPTFFQTSYMQLTQNSTDTVSALALQVGCVYTF